VRPGRPGIHSRNSSRASVLSRSRRRLSAAQRRKLAVRRNGNSAREGNRTQVDPRYEAAVRTFEAAARYFQKQNYQRAQELFEKLANGDVPEVGARARVHLRVCEQRLGRPRLSPKTAEEYYALGVSALNRSQTDEAVEYLRKATKLQPKREHLQYALAAAHAIRGEAEAALGHLQAAIALRPQNRILARHDEDFRRLAGDRRFQSLVYSASPQFS
jgi:tetratricopeptide (TPR) repeat protein